MKIFYISNSIIPSRTANSIQVMKMCHAFARNGHKVILLAPHKPKLYEKNIKNVYKFYGVDKIFKIKKLPSYKFKILTYKPDIYCLLSNIFSLLINSDIIYSRHSFFLLSSLFFGKKVIYEIHDPKVIDKLETRYLIKSKKLLHIVVISKKIKEMIKPKIKNKNIIVAHDGADIPQCNNVKEINKKYFYKYENELKIGYTGHLYSGKGYEIIFKLAKEISNINFHIFGGYQTDISRINKNSPQNVIFHGFVEHRNIPSILSNLDILLLPPLNKVAPFNGKGNDIGQFMSPLKMFEYMASGKPIIASNLPILKEVLTHKKNALLCNPEKLEDWITALKCLINNKELRQQLGKTARKEFNNKYTWLARANKVLDKT